MDEQRFDKLESKLDTAVVKLESKIDLVVEKIHHIDATLVEKIHNIDTTLAAQHESLKEHIRRTALLERTIEPVKRHVAMVEGALKLVGGISVLVTIIQIFRKFL